MPSNDDDIKRPTILVLEALANGAECVREAGGNVMVASPRDIDASLEALESMDYQGVLLTGGGDVDPRWYGQRPHKKTYGVNEDRDFIEGYAVEICRDHEIPMLGICRGSQVMTVALGGTLRQHINGHRATSHPVITEFDTILQDAAGTSPRVVSLHHQVVREVPDGWRVSGYSIDGHPEAVESIDGLCLGVQFHPEMDDEAGYARGIFRWLIERSSVYASIDAPPTAYPVRPKQLRQRVGVRRGRGRGNYRTTWLCAHCGMQFDEKPDRDDHMEMLHGMSTGDMAGT